MIALGVSLTTPLWYDGALRFLGLTTALTQAQREDALAIARQERRLRDMEQRLGAASAQLSRTQSELSQATRRQEETAAWTRVMILARLGEMLRQGVPFTTELAMARAAGAGEQTPLLDRLAPYAAIGVPTTNDLTSDFRRVTDPVLRPARGLNPIAWASAVYAMMPFVKPAPEADPGRIALRDASALVQAGRIGDAATLLRSAQGPVAELMAGWLADVEARATAEIFNRQVEALLRAGRR